LVQFVIFQNGDSFGGRGLDCVLAALVINDSQRAIGGNGVKLFGDQQVNIFVMLFE